jgi:orotidine-5'-phosphate decarboxylase
MIAEDSLIVALDVPNMNKASKLIVELGEAVSYYKVGMELFYGAQKEIIDYLKARGKQVFLDLKLHDIPNTVASAAAVLAARGVDMINLHAFGGREMMKKAAQAVRRAGEMNGQEPPRLIAVTVLTSLGAADWRELNNALPIELQALELAKLAQDCGLDGVVASPREAAAIRNACGREFLIVTPGIRPSGGQLDDQRRTATPRAAIEAGASHLVVGRPITQAAAPKEAARAILAEMREAKA